MRPSTFRLFLRTPDNVEIPTPNPSLRDQEMETQQRGPKIPSLLSETICMMVII